jgi:hypothetical protein
MLWAGPGTPRTTGTHTPAVMAANEEIRTAGGWTRLEEPPAGFPDAETVRLTPLREELEEMERWARQTQAMNGDSPEAKALLFLVDRLRKRVWEAASYRRELSPLALAKHVGGAVTDDTVRLWCQAGHVKHRRTGSGRYFVDVDSALNYMNRR